MAEAKLRARADMDTKGFDTGLAKMRQGVTTFTTVHLKKMAGAIGGVFAASQLIAFGKSAIGAGDDISDLSAKLKVLPDTLQALQVTADKTGGSVEGMNSALSKLQSMMNAAAFGNPKAAKALTELGLSADFIAEHQNDMGAVFEEVSKIMASSEGDMAKQAAAKVMLGDAYQELNATFKTVAKDGLQAVKEALIENNEIMGNKTVAALDLANEKMKTYGRTASTWGRKKLASPFTDMAQEMTLSKLSPEQIEKNRAAIQAALSGKDQSKIDKIMNAPMKDITVRPPESADQYARIGLFSGGQINNAPRMIMERQLKVAEEIESRLEKVQDLLDKVEKNTGDTAANLEE
jgi:hypothetical protein